MSQGTAKLTRCLVWLTKDSDQTTHPVWSVYAGHSVGSQGLDTPSCRLHTHDIAGFSMPLLNCFKEDGYQLGIILKVPDPEIVECLSIRRMSPVSEIKMSLISGTISSLGDNVINYIFVYCSAHFTFNNRMIKPDWETPAQHKLSFIRCFSKTHHSSNYRNEPPHDKTNNVAVRPAKTSDQPGHPPSLIRVFPVRLMGS